MKLSIVVPIFNEEKTLEKLLLRLNRLVIPSVVLEYILVDDGSSDASREIAQEFVKNKRRFVLISHKKNIGKGGALRTGFKKAKGDFIVIQDADLEYDPKQLASLMKPILDQESLVVYGTRIKHFPTIRKDLSKTRFTIHFIGNRLLSLLTSLLYFQWITDMETCYKIIPKKFLMRISIQSNGFAFEPEVTAKILKSGLKIKELPITTKPRGYKQGKKLRTIPDGLDAVWALIKYRFID